MATLDDKAKQYNSLLYKHDELARKVSLIQSKFDLSAEDNRQIEELRKEMKILEQRANRLVSNG